MAEMTTPPLDLVALRAKWEAAKLSELESVHIISPGYEHLANLVTAPDKPCFALMLRKEISDWLATMHNAFPAICEHIAGLTEERDNAFRYSDLVIVERDALRSAMQKAIEDDCDWCNYFGDVLATDGKMTATPPTGEKKADQ